MGFPNEPNSWLSVPAVSRRNPLAVSIARITQLLAGDTSMTGTGMGERTLSEIKAGSSLQQPP
jgi:hypothetical protein